MPGWIWVLLVIFMLVMIVAGAAYAFLKAKKSLSIAGALGSHVGKVMDKLGEEPEDSAPHVPALAQPLADTAKVYEDAHKSRLEYKQARRNKHTATWRRWEKFNTESKADVAAGLARASRTNSEGGIR